MTRIPLQPPRTLTYRLVEWYSRRRFGAVADPAAAMGAQHAGADDRRPATRCRCRKWHRLDPTLKALAEMTAAVTIGCSWCVDFGYWISTSRGVDPVKLENVPRRHESDVYTDLERAVMAYAEAATRDPTGRHRRDGGRPAGATSTTPRWSS